MNEKEESLEACTPNHPDWNPICLCCDPELTINSLESFEKWFNNLNEKQRQSYMERLYKHLSS